MRGVAPEGKECGPGYQAPTYALLNDLVERTDARKRGPVATPEFIANQGKGHSRRGTKIACRREIERELMRQVGLSRPQAERVINVFIDSIVRLVKAGYIVQFRRFGKFFKRDVRESVPGGTTYSGTPVTITGHSKLAFNAATEAKRWK